MLGTSCSSCLWVRPNRHMAVVRAAGESLPVELHGGNLSEEEAGQDALHAHNMAFNSALVRQSVRQHPASQHPAGVPP